MIKFKFFIACLALLPLSVNGEDISFTKHITYTGKVDANNQPSGKGKLEIIYNLTVDTRKDVLEGEFDNGVVKNAKLAFDKHNGPLWINSSIYKGTVEYSIASDGTSVTFKMTDGKFKDYSMRTVVVTPDYPFQIKRTPSDSKCEVEAQPFFTNFTTPAYHANFSDMFSPIAFFESGQEGKYCQAETFILSNEWKLTSIGTMDMLSFPDGQVFTKVGTRVGCEYQNGDNFTYDEVVSRIVSFRKTYQDAIVSYNCVKPNTGKQHPVISDSKEEANGEIHYTDKGTYKGSINIGDDKYPISDLFKKIMQSKRLADSGILPINGTLIHNGKSIVYTNGKSADDLAKEQQQQKEKAERDSIAAEKETEKLRKELQAKYSVANDADGREFMSAYHFAETGVEEAWAVVGYYLCNGIGVKKNVAKGIEYYKKAIDSEEECAQCFGKMFMANLLWTGNGVTKNQKKAALYYVDCVDYNGWVYSTYQHHYAKNVHLAYCRVGVAFETGIFGNKHIDGAIKAYSECVRGGGVYDEITAFAIYKLGYYIEKGRYKAIRNINGTYSPNIKLARSYYHDALSYGDAKTKNLAKQGLQRIGY